MAAPPGDRSTTEEATPSLPLVFAAGVVSFLSPCVLPLVPAYLSTISGVSFDPTETRPIGTTRRVVVASGMFFAGFLAVFIAQRGIAAASRP